jgi:hypothetical protein
MSKRKNIFKQSLVAVLLAMLLANSVSASVAFMWSSWFDFANIPFVSADREQYISQWSSGVGIVESVELIKKIAQTQTVAVATEGSFGTLPDGILMYLHKADVSNIYVEGIGYPVKSIPNDFRSKAKQFKNKLLIVNSHRQELELDNDDLITQYCRPNNQPCLQVWRIDNYLNKTKSLDE